MTFARSADSSSRNLRSKPPRKAINGVKKRELRSMESLKYEKELIEFKMVSKQILGLTAFGIFLLISILGYLYFTDTTISKDINEINTTVIELNTDLNDLQKDVNTLNRVLTTISFNTDLLNKQISGEKFSESVDSVNESVYLILTWPSSQQQNLASSVYMDSDGELWDKGTAFAITNKGVLLTAKHLIENKEKIKVFKDGEEVGEVLNVVPSEIVDVALLRINVDTKAVKLLDKEDVPIGTKIAFIGFPLNNNINPLIHEGIVSSKNIAYSEDNSFQISFYTINAFVNRGNSGGPIFLPNTGEVIGLVNAREFESVVVPKLDVNLDNLSDDTKVVLAYQNLILEQVIQNSQVGVGHSIGIDESILEVINPLYK